MTFLQFREWLVSRLRRSDITATSSHLYDAIAVARRDIQIALDLPDMEAYTHYTLSTGDASIDLPDAFKKEESLLIKDQSGNLEVILVKEPDRKKFNSLTVFGAVDWLRYGGDKLITVLDPQGIEGYPIIYNIWGNEIFLFPKVGAPANGHELWIYYYAFLPSDLSGAADSYTDCLFDQFAHLMFYRTMQELGLNLKDGEMVDRYALMYNNELMKVNAYLASMKESGMGSRSIE